MNQDLGIAYFIPKMLSETCFSIMFRYILYSASSDALDVYKPAVGRLVSVGIVAFAICI